MYTLLQFDFWKWKIARFIYFTILLFDVRQKYMVVKGGGWMGSHSLDLLLIRNLWSILQLIWLGMKNVDDFFSALLVSNIFTVNRFNISIRSSESAFPWVPPQNQVPGPILFTPVRPGWHIIIHMIKKYRDNLRLNVN